MESYPDNFETGSWTVRQTVRRPKTRFFALLSCLWLLVSVGASFPFWHGWPESFSDLEWFCGLLVVLEPVFVILAVVLSFTERPRIIKSLESSIGVWTTSFVSSINHEFERHAASQNRSLSGVRVSCVGESRYDGMVALSYSRCSKRRRRRVRTALARIGQGRSSLPDWPDGWLLFCMDFL